MDASIIPAHIAGGTIHYLGRSVNVPELEWTEHPSYSGVYLKHMIKGADTGGLFSSHMVRIDPLCHIETHCHENQVELHEIIGGNGQCRLSEETFEYHPGETAVIPRGVSHRVWAGKKGLILIAKFFPALI